MMLLAFVRALLRHFIAVMSSAVSLSIALLTIYRWIPQTTATDPRLWFVLSGLAFFYASFLTWRDEHERVMAMDGPKLVLECISDHPLPWQLINKGTDAVNVTS